MEHSDVQITDGEGRVIALFRVTDRRALRDVQALLESAVAAGEANQTWGRRPE